jgi:uncharacterized membrane protein
VESNIRELLDLVFRWVHLVAGIMWIGNSLLYNWLDRNLIKPTDTAGKPLSQGTIWLLHSGAFYEVEKKLLGPGEMPKVLHWFKWQAYTTWLTGVALLAIVYYAGGGAYMIDPAVSGLSATKAIALGVLVIVGAFAVYDLLWRSPIGRYDTLASALSLLLGGAVIWILTHTLSGRAAFIHVGAMLGTLMAGNVFMHIMPSQRALVAATESGRPQDPKLSLHAKQRSIHNNYMTFPLLFTMLSNHFAVAYNHPQSWLVLIVLFVGGAGVRHWLNVRFTFAAWKPALAATFVVAIGIVAFLVVRPPATSPTALIVPGDRVSFTTVRLIITQRCVPCHSQAPTDRSSPAAPTNVRFDTPDQIKQWQERIKARAVISKTMPLANKTKMTDDERDVLAAWFFEGAPTQ